MRKALLLCAVFFALLAGCRPEEKPDQLKAINYSLEKANEIITSDIKLAREAILQLQRDPQTFHVAEKLILQVNRINEYADSIYILVRNLKREVIAQSDSFKMEYVTVVKQLYDFNGAGAQLVNKLSAFKDSIPAIFTAGAAAQNSALQTSMDDYLKRVLKMLPVLPAYEDCISAEQRKKYKDEWLDKNFARSSSLMAMVMLNKIENDVLTTEKMLIDYCNSNVAINCGLRYDEFEAVALLSSSYVKKGQPIKVKAGIGAFSAAPMPTITIDGKIVGLNGGVIAMYEFIANGNPGKHTVPVRIEFTKPDGSKAMATQELEYVIAGEK